MNVLRYYYIIISLLLTILPATAWSRDNQPVFYSVECTDYNGSAVLIDNNFYLDTPTYTYQDDNGQHHIEYSLNILSLFTTPARTFLFYQACAKTAIGNRFVSDIEANCWSIRHMVDEGMIPFNYVYYIEEELQNRAQNYRLNIGHIDLADCFS